MADTANSSPNRAPSSTPPAPRPGRFGQRFLAYQIAAWLTLLALTIGHPLATIGVLLLCAYVTLPAVLLFRWRGWPFYPPALFRILVVRAVIYAMREVLPHMKSGGGGHIINISSGGAKFPGPGPYDTSKKPMGDIFYGAQKAAIERFSQQQAWLLQDENIAINVATTCRITVSTINRRKCGAPRLAA